MNVLSVGVPGLIFSSLTGEPVTLVERTATHFLERMYSKQYEAPGPAEMILTMMPIRQEKRTPLKPSSNISDRRGDPATASSFLMETDAQTIMNSTLSGIQTCARLAQTTELTLFYFAIPIIFLYLSYTSKTNHTKHGLPVVGHRTFWEPKWLVRLRFIRGSRSIIKEGYDKVSSVLNRTALIQM
jgi:hypothetical protein